MSLKSNLTGQIIRHGGSEAYFRLIIQASKISLLSSLAPMDWCPEQQLVPIKGVQCVTTHAYCNKGRLFRHVERNGLFTRVTITRARILYLRRFFLCLSGTFFHTLNSLNQKQTFVTRVKRVYRIRHLYPDFLTTSSGQPKFAIWYMCSINWKTQQSLVQHPKTARNFDRASYIICSLYRSCESKKRLIAPNHFNVNLTYYQTWFLKCFQALPKPGKRTV